MSERILVIDDETNIAWLFREIFGGSYEVHSAEKGKDGIDYATRLDFDLIMLDLKLPDTSGLDVLDSLIAQGCPCPIIIMTAYGEVKTAVRAMKAGAHDYITKPFDTEELKILVESALKYSRLSTEVTRLRHELEDKYHVKNMVTVSPKMMEIFSVIERVAASDVPVLIQGESGTGKEIIAKSVHYGSPRKDKPFVPINCAALPQNLLESELFGYEEGAFSGARRKKPGKFELAHGGTIFLDEVGELPLSMQPKILRALEEREIDRLGGTQRIPIDVRVVSASNKNLPSEVLAGAFRQDLYFRLAVIPVTVPPLRERKEDIPVLAKHFLKEYALEQKRPALELDEEAMATLLSYSWPGNVRELKNMMQQVSLLCHGKVISRKDLPMFFYAPELTISNVGGNAHSAKENAAMPLEDFSNVQGEVGLKDLKQQVYDEIEKTKIKEALDLFDNNRTQAAKHLNISRRTLQNKLKKYGL